MLSDIDFIPEPEGDEDWRVPLVNNHQAAGGAEEHIQRHPQTHVPHPQAAGPGDGPHHVDDPGQAAQNQQEEDNNYTEKEEEH